MTDTQTTLRVPVGRGSFALIDAADLPLVAAHTWHLHERRGSHGAMTEVGGRRVFMHSLILGLRAGERAYHRNGDRLDNRRGNLALAPLARRAPRANPSSGYIGVRFHERDRRWHAYIRIDRRTIHLGSYRSAVEAALAYDEAARRLFGENVALNLPDASAFRTARVGAVRESARLRVAAHGSGLAVPHIDSSSRYRGVSYRISEGAWLASIQVEGKRRTLGRFATPEEAARAYDRAAWEALGPRARLNLPTLGLYAKPSEGADGGPDRAAQRLLVHELQLDSLISCPKPRPPIRVEARGLVSPPRLALAIDGLLVSSAGNVCRGGVGVDFEFVHEL